MFVGALEVEVVLRDMELVPLEEAVAEGPSNVPWRRVTPVEVDVRVLVEEAGEEKRVPLASAMVVATSVMEPLTLLVVV